MPSLISRELDRAEHFLEAARTDCREAVRGVSSSGGLGGAIAASPGSLTNVSFGRYTQTTAHHADQYGFFTGYPYSIINIIANRLAAQPIRVAKLLKHGDRARRRFAPVSKDFVPKSLQEMAHRIEIYPEHRILRAIDSPNPIMVRHHLLYMTFASMEITGRGYWWMYVDEQTGLDQIWPVPVHWMEPVHEQDKLFAYYRLFLPGTGEPIKVPTRQVVPFLFPDPSDPFAALAPLQAMSRTVMTDFAIEMAQRMSFENGINPGLAIMVGKPPEFAGVGGDNMVLTKEQRDQVIAAVRRQYRGVTRFEEPLILDALIKDVKPITTAVKEMAYPESQTLARNRLTQGWGMNPITMGEMEGVNYASSGVADHHVARAVYNPRTEGNSQTMTRFVPPYFADGEEGLLVYQEPVQPIDPEMELSREQGDYDRGIISRNEVRQKRGRAPIEKGDRALTSSGWVRVREEGKGGGRDDDGDTPDDDGGDDGGDDRDGPVGHKTTDEHGQEHDELGRFGHGSGGGGGGVDLASRRETHDENVSERKKILAERAEENSDRKKDREKEIEKQRGDHIRELSLLREVIISETDRINAAAHKRDREIQQRQMTEPVDPNESEADRKVRHRAERQANYDEAAKEREAVDRSDFDAALERQKQDRADLIAEHDEIQTDAENEYAAEDERDGWDDEQLAAEGAEIAAAEAAARGGSHAARFAAAESVEYRRAVAAVAAAEEAVRKAAVGLTDSSIPATKALGVHANAVTKATAVREAMSALARADLLTMFSAGGGNMVGVKSQRGGKWTAVEKKKHRDMKEFVGGLLSPEFGDVPGVAVVRLPSRCTRACYILGDINVSPDSDTGTHVHEMGHHLEKKLSGAKDKMFDFLDRRCRNEKPTNMKEKFPEYGFSVDEQGYKDDFGKLFPDEPSQAYYIGKRYVYDDDEGKQVKKGTEVLSMGLEMMYRDPKHFAKVDPEYFDLMMSILQPKKKKPKEGGGS